MCFIFQAEDGIRDRNVTGVQTCALPISRCNARKSVSTAPLLACVAEPTGKTLTTAPRCGCRTHVTHSGESSTGVEIGRASCRERVSLSVVAVASERSWRYDGGHSSRGRY